MVSVNSTRDGAHRQELTASAGGAARLVGRGVVAVDGRVGGAALKVAGAASLGASAAFAGADLVLGLVPIRLAAQKTKVASGLAGAGEGDELLGGSRGGEGQDGQRCERVLHCVGVG